MNVLDSLLEGNGVSIILSMDGIAGGARGGAAGGAEASEATLALARERATEALSLPLVDGAIPEEAVWQCTTCGW